MDQMRFVSITVENMFAYHGRNRIDLEGVDERRNIVIVSGRNGTGKTSLLNALKLLFLGVNDEGLRRISVTRRERMLSARQYVRGLSNVWYGVVNRRAVDEGTKAASVCVEWMQSERLFKLSRIVSLAQEPFDETLLLEVDGVPRETDAAFMELQRLMPREFVPFFFFDGEQIQELAEAEPGREAADIERLLNLAFVGVLSDRLREFIRERHRAAYPEDVKVELTRHENDERAAIVELEACERERIGIEGDLLVMRDDARRLEEARDRLKGGISEEERRRLQARIDSLSTQRESLAVQIASSLPPEAPFLTNPRLVEAAFASLDVELREAGTSQATLFASLRDELPGAVAEGLTRLAPPVVLDDAQRRGLEVELGGVLGRLIPGRRSASPVFHSMTPRQIRELRDRFLLWRDRGPNQAAEHADLLRRMRSLGSEERRARSDLLDAEVTSDAARARYEQLGHDLTALNARILDRNADKVRLEPTANRLKERIAVAGSEIEALRRRYEVAVRDGAETSLAGKVTALLENLREHRRREKRGAVERRLNEKIGILLGSSHLVQSVKLDDLFAMSYLDARDLEVARTSISAGTRQLTATAMLWALKDEASRSMPMMIDTPLGRLDNENRSALARYYYPNAASPLILLPTNSELTPDIIDCIAPYVLRSYRIDNIDGDNASLVPDQGRTAVRYG